MTDKKKLWLLIFSAVLVLSLTLAGCGGSVTDAQTQPPQETEPTYQDVTADGNYTQTQLQKLLDDSSVTEIEITGMIGLNRPLTVTGEKIIKGTGMLVLVGDAVKPQVATALPDHVSGSGDVLTDWVLEEPNMDGCNYAVVVGDGGSLTLAGSVTVCANYAGESLLIEQGGAVTMTEEAVVNRSVNSNITNYGTLTLSGGSLAESSGYHIINQGTLNVQGGTVTGSGSGCAAIYSTGTVTMTGGLVQQAKIHGFYLASGSMTLSGGEISACEKDGVFVGKDATLNTTSSAAKVRQHGRNGIMNLGTAVIDAGRFTVNGEANVKNGVGGTMTINGGNITDSAWAGVYNCGRMEIHGGNIATNSYGGIINTGDLTMDGGALYANSGTAQLVNRGGTLKVTGQDVSVTSGKSVGIMNDLGGYAEITDIILMDQQAAHIRNWGEMYIHDLTLDNNSTSSAIYNDCGGYLKAENLTILNSYVHGIYNVAHATAELTDVTIETVGSRGIQNKGGTVIATNLYVNNSKGVAVGNDNDKDGDSGDVTITGLEVPYSYSGAIINQCGGTVTVNDAYIGATEKTAVKIEGGETYISGMTISRTVSTGDNVTHAIYLEGGYLCIRNSYIANPTGCALQNKAGTVVGYNLVLENSTNVAISNRYADNNKNAVGSVTIDGLTIRGTVKSGNIANVAGKLVIKNATLETTKTTNVSISGGSAVLENVKILGCSAASSPCLSVYNDATVTLRGDESEISGAVWRPVNVGTSSSTGSTGGTFIYEGGKIVAASETDAAVRLASDGAVMVISGDPQITGIVNYESDSALIEVADDLAVDANVVINPIVYMDGLQVLTSDDSALLEGNYQKFQLAVTNSVYEIGSDGCLKLKDGVSIVARNQATGKEYATLADAIAEAPTDGTGTVIEILDDIVLSSPVQVTDGRNIVLTDDGTAHTISRDFTSSTNNQNMMFYIKPNSAMTLKGTENGGLTIQGMGEDNTENASAYRLVVRVGDSKDTTAKLIIEDGVTITGNYSEQSGGVALVYGTVEMNGGTITGNKTTKNGGVFQMASGSSVIINGGSITNNTAGGTGGVFQISANAALTVNGGEISGNNSGGAGGAIQVAANGSLTINGGTISGNHSGAEMNGGAIQLANNATMVMTGGSITGNAAEKNGGGVNVNNSTVTISGGTITGNTADGTGADINVANKGASVTVSGNAAAENVYLVGDGRITVSEGAALGDVTYGGAGAVLAAGGELTAETVATIIPAADAYDGCVIVESASAALWEGRFVLDEESVAGGKRIVKAADSENAVLYIPAPVVMPLELSIDGGSTYTGYASLAEAIEAIPEGGSGIVRIKEDIEVLSALTVDRNVTITDDGTARAITASGIMFQIANNATLTLEGSAGLTLNGGNDRMIWVGSANGDTNAKLVINDGVTLTGTNASRAGSVAYTYGVIEMNGGLITGNVTTGNGTIFVGGNQGSFTMTGGTISGNTANNGGGIAVGNNTNAVITGGTISGNTAKTSGGGIQIFNATVSISGTAITGNTAATYGGNINVNTALPL